MTDLMERLKAMQLDMLQSSFNEQQAKTKKAVMEVELLSTQQHFAQHMQELVHREQQLKVEKAEVELRTAKLVHESVEKQIGLGKIPKVN